MNNVQIIDTTQIVVLSATAFACLCIAVGYFFGKRRGYNYGFNDGVIVTEKRHELKRRGNGQFAPKGNQSTGDEKRPAAI